jgi:hypothetical protein
VGYIYFVLSRDYILPTLTLYQGSDSGATREEASIAARCIETFKASMFELQTLISERMVTDFLKIYECLEQNANIEEQLFIPPCNYTLSDGQCLSTTFGDFESGNNNAIMFELFSIIVILPISSFV